MHELVKCGGRAAAGFFQLEEGERHNGRKEDDRVELEPLPPLAKSCSFSSRSEIPPGPPPMEMGTTEEEEENM